jgi:mRNA-degrading endonuclease toxin of MazEF toxin-antitoxin module
VAGIWQVYWVSQLKAQANTQPPQPTDPSKPRRMYVIVAPTHTGNNTCCPIQDKGKGIGLTEVELLAGFGGFIAKDSKILCHQVFTLPDVWFHPKDRVGMLGPQDQERVKAALRNYFRLH